MGIISDLLLTHLIELLFFFKISIDDPEKMFRSRMDTEVLNEDLAWVNGEGQMCVRHSDCPPSLPVCLQGQQTKEILLVQKDKTDKQPLLIGKMYISKFFSEYY